MTRFTCRSHCPCPPGTAGAVRCLVDVTGGLLFAAAAAGEDPPAARLVSLLVILTKICSNNPEGKRQLKAIIFPNPATRPPPAAVVEEVEEEEEEEEGKEAPSGLDPNAPTMTQQQMQAMIDPADAPTNTVRGQIIRLMTSLNSGASLLLCYCTSFSSHVPPPPHLFCQC